MSRHLTFTLLLLTAAPAAAHESRTEDAPVPARCDRAWNTSYELQGPLAAYLKGVSEQWLKVAPAANPGMLEMFRDRDRQPYRNLEPWAGDFAGKYLTGAVQVLRLTGDRELKEQLADFVKEW